MNEDTFKAFYVREKPAGHFVQTVTEVPFSFLPDHEVLIEVSHSSLNYKDALSASGNKGVTRQFPHIPGIDAAGRVVFDESGTFKKNQQVIVTGQDLGSNTPGGYGQFIRVPKHWVIALPENMTPETAMLFGTAGFTAMYGLMRLQREGILSDGGPVLVTGATGGVGSLAVFFLSQYGYEVIAATGKLGHAEFLREMGARVVINRDEVTQVKNNFLLKRRWNAAIETVGGKMLDAVIRQTNHDGAVACCGNILGEEVKTNIYPFILRGVSLLGIDSAICKMPMRLKIWAAMSQFASHAFPEGFSRQVELPALKKEIKLILKGQQKGRVIVRHC